MWVDRFKQDSGSGTAVYEELREVIVGALGVRLRFVPRVGLGVSAMAASDDTPTVKLPAPVEPAVAPPAPVERVEPPAPVEPVEPEEPAAPAAPQPKPQPEAERRGEAVVRELLGATLVSVIGHTDAKLNGADESDELLDLEPRAE
jgi:hypothetical protein